MREGDYRPEKDLLMASSRLMVPVGTGVPWGSQDAVAAGRICPLSLSNVYCLQCAESISTRIAAVLGFARPVEPSEKTWENSPVEMLANDSAPMMPMTQKDISKVAQSRNCI